MREERVVHSGRPHLNPGACNVAYPVLIHLLGEFSVVKSRRPARVPLGAKSQVLVSRLALAHRQRVSRDALLALLWPESDRGQAGQSLNSLIYSINKLLNDEITDGPAVMQADGYYYLNVQAGIGVDVGCFDCLADAGDQEARTGNLPAALSLYAGAVQFYGGDLCVDHDVQAILERERLRARHLTLLARLADHHYALGEYEASLGCAMRLLAGDPCREDAHRLIMRCYVRQGERAQALRQYQVCESILRVEFDARPEPATVALFDQVRLDPGAV